MARENEQDDAGLEDATPTVKRASIKRAGKRSARAAGSAPVSMLGWRRQTHAFEDTSASLSALAATTIRGAAPIASAAPEPVASTPGAESDTETPKTPPQAQTNTQREKPVIIAGARGAAHRASATRPVDAKADGGHLRSPAGRVVMIGAIVATLFASLAVVAPTGAVGVSSGLPGVFQSYASAMPWSAPTPTPRPATPVVTTGSPSQQAIIADIRTVFGPNAAGALNVARCESGFDAHAWNSTPVGGSHASGVFQILYPSTWHGTSYAGYSPYDEWANVRAAYEIFKRDGYSWREWACKP